MNDVFQFCTNMYANFKSGVCMALDGQQVPKRVPLQTLYICDQISIDLYFSYLTRCMNL
jgi:hypothetical protein